MADRAMSNEEIDDLINKSRFQASGETVEYRTACYLHTCMILMGEIAKRMDSADLPILSGLIVKKMEPDEQ